jgi:hypothetical protein
MKFLRLFALAVLSLAAACGSKIGDSCSVASDCAADGTRLCDQTSPGGYCTIPGCDVDTCPEDSECVQFYSVINLSKTCASEAECTIDEVCTVGGLCAPRSSEVRFCMATCGGHGDCRTGYECRDLTRMGMHGGQPVPKDGQSAEDLSPFCAASLPCTTDAQCDLGDTCDTSERRCRP